MENELLCIGPEYPQRVVIFLDIDGVLNSGAAHEGRTWEEGEPGFKHFSPGDWVEEHRLKTFLSWLKACDYLVVGVSSWFYGENSTTLETEMEHNNTVADFLGIRDRFLGCVEYTGGGSGRGASVLKYVEENSIEKWGVLDDSQVMYSWDIDAINGRFGVSSLELLRLWRKIEGAK